jgi:hypothetical protein
MKLSLLTEDIRDSQKRGLSMKLGIDPSIIQQAGDADPTDGKYVEWILENWRLDYLDIPEDLELATIVLQDFESISPQELSDLGFGRKNINYKTFQELIDISDAYSSGIMPEKEEIPEPEEEPKKKGRLLNKHIVAKANEIYKKLAESGEIWIDSWGDPHSPEEAYRAVVQEIAKFYGDRKNSKGDDPSRNGEENTRQVVAYHVLKLGATYLNNRNLK